MDNVLKYTILPGCPVDAPIKPPHYDGDVGFDMGIAIHEEYVVVLPNSFANIRTYVCLELPKGMWGDIRARSSTFAKRRLIVMPATIDNKYRGEISIFLYNPNDEAVKIYKGDYLAQLVLLPIDVPQLQRVETLSPTVRGMNAFGSSGGYRESPNPSRVAG